jgi:aminopeptidase
MNDPRIVKIADVLVNYSMSLKPGERVLIQGGVAAAPLIRAFYREALRAGANPTTNIILPGLNKIFFDEADEAQLSWIPEHAKVIYESYEAVLTIWSDVNTREGTHFDAEKRAIQARAMKPLQETFRQRMASGELKWCGTLYPTPAHAQDADMATEDFEDFVFNACLPDPDDPVGYWRGVEARQDKLIQRLSQYDEIRIVAPDTDITVKVGGRTWINASGHLNFPDGEIYTSPHKEATSGHVHFTFPAVYRGVEVEDVQLWFEAGKVIKAAAGKGEDFLLAQLDTDEGARFLGEFAIGTNPMVQQFMKNTLFDEKIKGTIHMALGMAFPEAGGSNMSSVHWDMVLEMRNGGQLFGNGELIYENGEFLFQE